MADGIYDVLIIGGGPAGLSLAGSLARQLHTGLVLDSATYRNERGQHMHNVPGWDHRDPADFRAKIREDLNARYASIQYRAATIESVRKLDDHFEAVDQEGHIYKGRKLGLATGVRDRIEDEVEGYAECWGRGIFHCLFCDGFEERGADSVGLFVTSFLAANAADVVAIARMAKRLARQVTIYTNNNHALGSKLYSEIQSRGIKVDERPVARLSMVGSGSQVRLDFADGSPPVTEAFIASHPWVEQRAGDLVAQLGLELNEGGVIKVTAPFNETGVKGCFAAGDAATAMTTVVEAIQMGLMAGVGCTMHLQQEMEKKGEL